MPKIPNEVLQDLRDNLLRLSARDSERHKLIERTAFMFNCCKQTVYSQLSRIEKLHKVIRKDHGHTRYCEETDFKRWVEIVAAIKLATLNKKGRHLSTSKAISLAEEGFYLEARFEQIPKGVLTRSSCDRWMRSLGINIQGTLRQLPCIRFEAKESNECWQFDISISDAYYLDEQKALPEKNHSGYPHLALFSVVDDYSRVNYQEYHLVYGEEIEAGLLFLFRAFSPKSDATFPFQGIPKIIYMDNGPLAKSRVVRRVLEEKLGIEIKVHQTPEQATQRRTSARAKGKVERCFRVIKESFETLFHFHKPQTVTEANLWLFTHLLHYNCQKHPSKESSRLETWVSGLPVNGFRQMCSWETYCTFAREPEFRTVALDGSISLDNQSYQVTAELIGERVEVWKGVFDKGIYVQDKEGILHGPFEIQTGTIELGTYRRWRKTERDKRIEKIEQMASDISIPREALTRDRRTEEEKTKVFTLPSITFVSPIGMLSENYSSSKEARRGIFQQFGIALATLSDECLKDIEKILEQTLNRREVYRLVKDLFKEYKVGG